MKHLIHARAAAVIGLGAIVCFVGCAVGPNYERPETDAPGAFRKAKSDHASQDVTTNSFGEMDWWSVYNDPQLRVYIAEALTNSWDIKIAAARVLQAEATLRVTRSQFFPTVNAQADYYTARASQRGTTPIPSGINPQAQYGDVALAMPAYEVDLWGRIRRANEAARARLLATEDAQRTVRQALVAQIATAYFELLELDLELDIGIRSYGARTNSLELTKSREEGGVASLQDVYQAQILVSTAEASIADTHRRIEQQEDLLSFLLGRNPGDIQRGVPLTAQTILADVPAGIPSALLERRPDLRAAEQDLVAANADIGQAKAAFYPQITLTGLYGYQSVALSDLFTGSARTWQFGPAVTLPLFTGGKLRGNLKLAEATFQESVARYQQTVQGAFREVSDALIARKRSRELRQKQEDRTQAHRNATELANVRYEGGVTSYLEVLYNEQELFNAELGLAQVRRDEFLSVVQLYRALGGGWETSAADQASTAK